MPDAVAAATPLDRPRLERIVAPWAADTHGPAIAIEDPSGAVVAGRTATSASDDPGGEIRRDVVVDTEVVARVVASGHAASIAAFGPAIEALAIAIGELVTETRAHEVAERAILEARTVAADTLGADAAELAKGRRQQRSIVSLVAPDIPGYDLASHYAAAHEIGGDFFELFRLRRRGHPLAIVIADVTGKGLDAALLMAFTRPVMHSALEAARGPADALQRTNRVLVGERRGTLFVTASCAVLQPRTGQVRIAEAGHEPALLVPGDGGPITPVGDPGVLLGAFGTLVLGEAEVTLEPGDTLFFYTDGATDAVGPSGERFGDDRLVATIEAARGGSAHDLVAAVRDAVQAFQADGEPADDLTLVAVGRHRPRRARRVTHPVAIGSDADFMVADAAGD